MLVYKNDNLLNSAFGLSASIFLTINEIIIKFGGKFIDFMTLTVFEILMQSLLSVIFMGIFEHTKMQIPDP